MPNTESGRERGCFLERQIFYWCIIKNYITSVRSRKESSKIAAQYLIFGSCSIAMLSHFARNTASGGRKARRAIAKVALSHARALIFNSNFLEQISKERRNFLCNYNPAELWAKKALRKNSAGAGAFIVIILYRRMKKSARKKENTMYNNNNWTPSVLFYRESSYFMKVCRAHFLQFWKGQLATIWFLISSFFITLKK